MSAANTDDRPAETIRSKPYNSADELARSVEELLAENARAETRIEVLEAALRFMYETFQHRLMDEEKIKVQRARAAPSGEQG